MLGQKASLALFSLYIVKLLHSNPSVIKEQITWILLTVSKSYWLTLFHLLGLGGPREEKDETSKSKANVMIGFVSHLE